MNLCFKIKSRAKAETEHCLKTINYCTGHLRQGLGSRANLLWAEARSCAMLGTACKGKLRRPAGRAQPSQQQRWCGDASTEMYLRKGKNTTQSEEEGTTNKMRNRRGNTSVREGGRGGSQWWGRYLPALLP